MPDGFDAGFAIAFASQKAAEHGDQPYDLIQARWCFGRLLLVENERRAPLIGCEYIANILEMKARDLPEPGALHLIRHQDLLDIELAQPDLSRYGPEQPHDES